MQRATRITDRWIAFAPQMLSILRIVAAFIFIFGGSLMLVGLFTRPIAFILAGEMAVAYFQFHAPSGFWPQINNGMPAVLYCWIWLYISAAGAGPWSLDAKRKRRTPVSA